MAAKTLWLYYLSFSKTTFTPTTDTPTRIEVLSEVVQSDDSPFQAFALPNKFNFGGEETSIVYVNPNGAIHMSKEQPCYPYSSFGAPSFCDFNSSYYGAIGGYLTDLDPSGSKNANISASYYSNRVKFNYDQIDYFGSNLGNSFSVSLYTDDRIELEYSTIGKNTSLNLPFKKFWISGLRPSFNSSVYIDTNDRANSLSEWHTRISGFYPSSKSLVSSGNSFMLCPVSLFWCLREGTRSLTELQATAASLTGASLELITGKLSCIEEIDYGLVLSYTMSGSLRTFNANCSESFIGTVNTTSDGYGLLSCPISSAFVSTLSSYLGASSSVLVNVTVNWRSVKNGVTAWKSLPLSTTTLQISSAASISNPTCRCSSNSLHKNTCETVTSYASSPCSGDFTCTSPTKCYQSAYARSLFNQPNCQNNCTSPTNPTSLATTYVSDPTNRCCTADELDCAGYCNGGNRQGYVEAGSTSRYCCAAQFTVDCDGVCGGSKVINGCGYCVSPTQATTCTAVASTVQLSSANASGIYYLSYSTTTGTVASRLTGITTSPPSLRRILRSDDSPFARVNLPRPFLFNGRYTNRIFVNPNGAIHFTQQQPCYPNNNFASSIAGSLCNFDNAYYDAIAGFLTDLNPSSSLCTGVNVTMTTFSDHVDINFIGFCYYYSIPLRNTFTISLYDDDGRVILHYHSLLKSVALSLPVTSFWVSGIRPPRQNTAVLVDNTYRTISRNVWNTAIAGVYPASQNLVSTGRAFVMCPITLFWCLRMSSRTVSAFTQSPIVELVTPKISCLTDIRYGVVYSWTTTHRMPATMFVSCNASKVTTGGGFGLLRCRVPTTELVARARAADDGFAQMHMWVQWQARNVTSAVWTALPMPPVTLTVLDNATATPSSSCDCNSDGAPCGTGPFTFRRRSSSTVGNLTTITTTSRTSEITYAQSMCSGNFTCLNRPCFTSTTPITTSSVERLFLDSDCQGNCSATLSTANAFMADTNKRCCAVDRSTDCAGQCFSNSSVALNSDGAEVCCAAGFVIDCAGYCAGGRVVNVCGVCTATDPNGNACFSSNQLILSTFYRNDPTSLYPVYDLVAEGRKETVEVIQLRNNARVPITVSVTVANVNDPLAPNVYPPTNLTTLNVGQRQNVTFPTSIVSLYTGAVTQWSLRTIIFTFYRTSLPSPSFSRVVYLYPLVKSCSHLSDDRDTCMRMPGCFFCLEYPSQYFVTTEKIEIRVRRSTSRRLAMIDGETSMDGTSAVESAGEEGVEEGSSDNSGSEESSSSSGSSVDIEETTEASSETLSQRRRLFSGFVPTLLNYLTINERSKLTMGTCIDGWRAEHCRLYRSDLRNANNATVALPTDKVVHYLGGTLSNSAMSSSMQKQLFVSTLCAGLSSMMVMVWMTFSV